MQIRCLVLGGGGFVGSHLVKFLLSSGYRVRTFDRAPAKPDDANLWSPEFESIQGDFQNRNDLLAAMDGCDVCFHLISTTTPRNSNLNPLGDIAGNCVATVQFLMLAAGRLKKVIFLSSGGTVYGPPLTDPIGELHPTDPICSYGIGKLAIEKYLGLFERLHGLEYTVLRLANPYGEGQPTKGDQGAIAVFLGKVQRGESLEIWGDGTAVRDYIYIDDVISAMVKSMQRTESRIFNIGSGSGNSINEILDILENVVGRPVQRNYTPARVFDVSRNVLDIQRAESELDWRPRVPLRDGITRFARWLKVT